MTDLKQKKVTTTIRFDPDLHRQLTDFIHEAGRGKKPRDRPSVDAMVQAAVAMLVAVPDSSTDKRRGVPDQERLRHNAQLVLRRTPQDDNLHPSGAGVVLESDEELEWVQRMLRALRAKEQNPLVAQSVETSLLMSEAVLGVVESKASGDAHPGSPAKAAFDRETLGAVHDARGGLRDADALDEAAKRSLRKKGGDREKTG